MKHLILFTACFGLLSLAACKKDRTCNCTETDTLSTSATTTTTVFKKISKKEAKDACSNYAKTQTSNGSTYASKTDCKLK